MADIQLIMEVVGQQDMVKAINTAERMGREYEKLDKTFNKGKMLPQQYAKGVAQLDAKYEALARTTNRLTTATNQQAAAQALAGKRINRMGANLQQVGYQVGDFAVQVQGGTNAAVALGQQGAQLLGIFGAGGALAGAALAIGTAFIAPLMRAEKETAKLVDRIKDLKEEVEDLRGFSLPPEYVAGLAKAEDVELRIISAEDELLKVRQRNEDVLKRSLEESLAYQNAQSEIAAEEGKVNLLLAERADIQKLLGDYASAFQDKIQLLHDQEEVALGNEIALLSMKIQFGKDSLAVRQLEKAQILAAYKDELKRLGLNPTLVQGLLDQKSAAMNLADELERAEQADLRRSKIKFPNLGMSGAMLALNYQQYGESRAAAPTSPPTVKPISGGVGGGGSKVEDPIVAFQKQLDLQQALIGKTEEQKDLLNALGVDYQSKYSPAVVSALETQITMTNILTEAEAKRKEAIEEATRQQEQLADFIGNSMGDALMSIVDGTMSVKDAFKSMASDIIKELYRVLVVQQLVNAAKTAFGFADGGAFSGGSQVQAYANGGVVGGPTYFPMSGGKTGLMGEAGPEAIMPLKRGANGKLGVQMEGGGGNTTVVQNFNFSANGDDSVKKIIAQAAPQIANMTKKSIMDDRRRGGQMKATFG